MRVCMLFATYAPIFRNKRDSFNCDLENATITAVYCVTNRQHFNFLRLSIFPFVLKALTVKKLINVKFIDNFHSMSSSIPILRS